MEQLTHGSLFAGIGGFDLGFERAGIKTIWQVEIDPFCQKILEKHWPEVARFNDVRTFGKHGWLGLGCDIITGGFPCQDISCAGQRLGIDGPKSGLWSEFFRIISAIRPRFVVVENVADILHRGIERVLSDLASIGFDAEWSCVTAAGFNAPHIRERFFLVGYPHEFGLSQRGSESLGGPSLLAGPCCMDSWPENTTQPDVFGVANGIPKRVDRVKVLGNSLVPQIAEWIGRRIVAVASQEGQ